MVDLPTPPFAEDTAMTLFTSVMGRLSGRPRFMRDCRFGGVPLLGSPYHSSVELEIAHVF